MLYNGESLSEHYCKHFFSIEFSNFPPGLALHALHCRMMVKLCNNAKSSRDVCRAEG